MTLMTLTINVPDEVAARVSALAEAGRRIIDDAASAAVADVLAKRFAVALNSHVPPRPKSCNPIPWDDFAALVVEGLDPNIPPLSDYAVSSEGIYEDHL